MRFRKLPRDEAASIKSSPQVTRIIYREHNKGRLFVFHLLFWDRIKILKEDMQILE
jgi:hypothetical protein